MALSASRKSSASNLASGATDGYEAQLWQIADALRGSMDAAEYMFVQSVELIRAHANGKGNGGHKGLGRPRAASSVNRPRPAWPTPFR